MDGRRWVGYDHDHPNWSPRLPKAAPPGHPQRSGGGAHVHCHVSVAYVVRIPLYCYALGGDKMMISCKIYSTAVAVCIFLRESVPNCLPTDSRLANEHIDTDTYQMLAPVCKRWAQMERGFLVALQLCTNTFVFCNKNCMFCRVVLFCNRRGCKHIIHVQKQLPWRLNKYSVLE